MKKLLSLLAAVAFVATSSAQVIVSYDFENGTNEGWSVWNKQTNKMVEGEQAKDGKYAYEVKIGTSFGVKGLREGETYIISADTRYVGGKDAPQVAISYYSSETKKNAILQTTQLPTDKAYTKFVAEFTPKQSIGHRFTFSAAPGKPCTFVLDNVKIEKKK